MSVHAISELPVPETSPDDAGRTTDEVLRSPDFNYEPTLLERALERVGEFLSDLLSPLFNIGGGGATGTIIGYGFIVLMGLALVWLIWRLLRDRFPKPDLTPDSPVIELSRWMNPKELRKAAEEFEAAGNWREALRARYRLLISQLVESGLIENPPGRTTGEYRQVVGSDVANIANEFSDATGDFERVWYGTDTATQGDVATMRSRADELPQRAVASRPVGVDA